MAMDYNHLGEPIVRTMSGFSDSTNLSAFSRLRTANKFCCFDKFDKNC
jgi:hypothetical protein